MSILLLQGKLRGSLDKMKVGRNDPCPCGSGKKYKKCCWRKDKEEVPVSVQKEEPMREFMQQILEAEGGSFDDKPYFDNEDNHFEDEEGNIYSMSQIDRDIEEGLEAEEQALLDMSYQFHSLPYEEKAQYLIKIIQEEDWLDAELLMDMLQTLRTESTEKGEGHILLPILDALQTYHKEYYNDFHGYYGLWGFLAALSKGEPEAIKLARKRLLEHYSPNLVCIDHAIRTCFLKGALDQALLLAREGWPFVRKSTYLTNREKDTFLERAYVVEVLSYFSKEEKDASEIGTLRELNEALSTYGTIDKRSEAFVSIFQGTHSEHWDLNVLQFSCSTKFQVAQEEELYLGGEPVPVESYMLTEGDGEKETYTIGPPRAFSPGKQDLYTLCLHFLCYLRDKKQLPLGFAEIVRHWIQGYLQSRHKGLFQEEPKRNKRGSKKKKKGKKKRLKELPSSHFLSFERESFAWRISSTLSANFDDASEILRYLSYWLDFLEDEEIVNPSRLEEGRQFCQEIIEELQMRDEE